jgi:nicotinamide mononucleotide transporter
MVLMAACAVHLQPMSAADIYQQVINQHLSPLEATAVIFGMTSVLLAHRNSVWLYPAGIVSTSIFIYILSRPAVGLYADALLNVYYLVMSIYGWAIWWKGHEDRNRRAISSNNTKDWLITAGIVVIGWLLLYTVLTQFTDSTVPAWDAFISATAWAGMWLLAKHKLENWILLNISNAVSIPLLLIKGLPLTALLTVVLFIVAVSGYFSWRKAMHEQAPAQ